MGSVPGSLAGCLEPGSPVGSLPKPRASCCSGRHVITAVHKRAQACRNSGIVIRSELGCECGGHIAQEVVGPRRGAEVQQQPGSLKIWHVRDAGEETLPALGSEGGGYVLIRTERCAEDEEALAISGESPVSGPDGLFASAAQVRDVGRFFTAGIPDAGLAAIELNARVLAECSLARCCSSRIRSRAATT